MKFWLVVLAIIPALPSAEQSQSCPLNSNFSAGNLLHWQAYTGNNKEGNGPTAIKVVYDSSQASPEGTIGASAFPEYNLPGIDGIQVVNYQGTDPFGGFPVVPTINGYAYHYSILLGSTSVATRQGGSDPVNGPPGTPPPATTGASGPQGGYVRGISYLINVPYGPPGLPYTMTYAYAMVLENGTHASLDQPMARAIVSTPNGVITCASPEYFLPTSGGGLDSTVARANGFSPSSMPTPNESPDPAFPGQHLQDVWTKGWTEVTFDLTQYRGQQVSLTFEADNCVPGGHFAYAYFAVRDVCAGLPISGDTLACANSITKYYIPSLDSATYNWTVPPGWTINPPGDGNSISVKVGPESGVVAVNATNNCTSLTNSLFVHLYPGALPEATIDPGDTTICYGGAAHLQAVVTTGTEYSWTGLASLRPGVHRGAISSLPFTTTVAAAADQTTEYFLNLHNDGCPINVTDTFTVTVVPPIQINLSRDTLVVVDQPLHFQAQSSDLYKDVYQWSPTTYLSDPNIADPIATFGSELSTITYQVQATDSLGCYGTAAIKVTIAPALPDFYVPNAFTPGTGNNSLFRPVCMGIATLDYFRVYNRWGQLLFSTSQIGAGWDGRIDGKLQESNAYLWILKGTDYTGRVISKKGTVVLIR